MILIVEKALMKTQAGLLIDQLERLAREDLTYRISLVFTQ